MLRSAREHLSAVFPYHIDFISVLLLRFVVGIEFHNPKQDCVCASHRDNEARDKDDKPRGKAT